MEIGAWTPPSGNHARDAPSGPDDHTAADLLAQDPVRRADVVASFGRDRRRLQSEPVLADRARRLVHDLVGGGAAVGQREVEARKLEVDPVTSGARTRSASSSSSCPVSSPSSTTIVLAAASADTSGGACRGEGAGGARGRASASAISTRAETDHRRGEARTDRARWSSRRPGKTCGSRRGPARSSRQRA